MTEGSEQFAGARRVLFLCTGNFYRSRFAEHLFNHLAVEAGLRWRADSRGLAVERLAPGLGPIAGYATGALAARGIEVEDWGRGPKPVSAEALEDATLVVALKESEHRPLLAERWPGWETKATYWHVDDVDGMTPEEATDRIAAHVEELVDLLRAGDGAMG